MPKTVPKWSPNGLTGLIQNGFLRGPVGHLGPEGFSRPLQMPKMTPNSPELNPKLENEHSKYQQNCSPSKMASLPQVRAMSLPGRPIPAPSPTPSTVQNLYAVVHMLSLLNLGFLSDQFRPSPHHVLKLRAPSSSSTQPSVTNWRGGTRACPLQ